MREGPPIQETPANARRRSRRSFIGLGISLLATATGWKWILSQSEKDGVPWTLRKVLEFNDHLWAKIQSPSRIATPPPAPPVGTPPRVNGDIGIEEADSGEPWQLDFLLPGQSVPHALTMTDLRAMPRVETTALFKCIEGWSEPVAYAGVRFSDFLRQMKVDALPAYAGLRTPDGKYYVSIDIESMLHPQTLLAYEMNGRPLSPENGAPLRLIIPIKYGIKSLKRIGSLYFSNTRPPDYWEQQGYDWFAGL